MDNSKKKQNQTALKNMYGLMMESIYHSEYSDNEIEECRQNSEIMEQVAEIRRMAIKYQAKAKKSFFELATERYYKLKAIGLETLKEALSPAEQVELQPLFSKFEEISEDDAQKISQDQELLMLLDILAKKVEIDE